MSTIVDGVVVVCKHKQTPVEMLNSTKKSLENVNANILGVVLNQTESKGKKYYGHYYGHYYG